jgi:hypothetical protein
MPLTAVYPNERLRIVVVTVLGGCLAVAFITREFYQGVCYVSTGRASMVIGNQETDPNGMAASLLLPTSLAIGLSFLGQKWVGKTLALPAALAMGFCIFLTMSRGAALALIMVAVIYLRRLNKVRPLIAVCLLLFSLLFVPGAFSKRFGSAAVNGGAGRVPIWTAGLEALKHFWVQGAGVNNFLQIVFTGLRPGEKLFEEIRLKGERMKPTPHEKIFVLEGGTVAFDEVRRWLEDLLSLVDSRNVHALMKTLVSIVPEYWRSEEVAAQSELHRHDQSLAYRRARDLLTASAREIA